MSSWDASETNWRSVISVCWSLSVSLLNSVASVAYSSEPRIWILWLVFALAHKPSLEVRICRIAPSRR